MEKAKTIVVIFNVNDFDLSESYKIADFLPLLDIKRKQLSANNIDIFLCDSNSNNSNNLIDWQNTMKLCASNNNDITVNSCKSFKNVCPSSYDVSELILDIVGNIMQKSSVASVIYISSNNFINYNNYIDISESVMGRKFKSMYGLTTMPIEEKVGEFELYSIKTKINSSSKGHFANGYFSNDYIGIEGITKGLFDSLGRKNKFWMIEDDEPIIEKTNDIAYQMKPPEE